MEQTPDFTSAVCSTRSSYHTVMKYAKITFANAPLFPDVYFVSFNNCVFVVSSVAIVLGRNICVCHLLSNKDISISVCERKVIVSVSVSILYTMRYGRLTCAHKLIVLDFVILYAVLFCYY